MIQRRAFSEPLAFPVQDLRPRQRVIRSSAQVAWYYLLGLVTVSLLVGLNVFLASETAMLKQQIRQVQEQCKKQEQRNAALRRQIALNTNINEVEEYALQQGFVPYPRIVYLDMGGEQQQNPGQVVTNVSPRVTQGKEHEIAYTPASSPWQILPQRLRELIALPRAGSVATRR